MTENEIAKIVVDCSYKIHTGIGPGFLESVYEEILSNELIKRRLSIERQKCMPVFYEETKMELGFRADIVIENKVILELKSLEVLAPVHS
jgi:GxxExxY protein